MSKEESESRRLVALFVFIPLHYETIPGLRLIAARRGREYTPKIEYNEINSGDTDYINYTPPLQQLQKPGESEGTDSKE